VGCGKDGHEDVATDSKLQNEILIYSAGRYALMYADAH